MSIVQHHGGAVILLSFFIAFALQIVGLPDSIGSLRPDWVVLVLVYWCIAIPDRIGVGVGWLIGLMLDVTNGVLLGQNAFILAVVAYLALRLHQRVRVFPLWQQSVSVMLLVALHLMLALWIKGILGQSIESWAYWLPALSSLFAWPVVYLSLRRLRREYRVR